MIKANPPRGVEPGAKEVVPPYANYRMRKGFYLTSGGVHHGETISHCWRRFPQLKIIVWHVDIYKLSSSHICFLFKKVWSAFQL